MQTNTKLSTNYKFEHTFQGRNYNRFFGDHITTI